MSAPAALRVALLLLLGAGSTIPAAPVAAQDSAAHALPPGMPAEAARAYAWLSRLEPDTRAGIEERARNRMRVLHALAAADGKWMDSAAAQLAMLSDIATPAVLDAYAGALEMLRAKYAFWPPRKLEHVREARRLLDRAVGTDPHDVEVRYVRLLSGHYLPFFLRDGEQVDADARAVAALLPTQAHRFPAAWSANLAAFVLETFELPRDTADPLRRLAGHSRPTAGAP